MGPEWTQLRRDLLELLQRDREIREIAALVGAEALEDRDRLVLSAARAIRDAVLGQSAFDPNDALSSLDKTFHLARLAREAHRQGAAAMEQGRSFDHLDFGAIHQRLLDVRNAGDDLPQAVERADQALRALHQEAP